MPPWGEGGEGGGFSAEMCHPLPKCFRCQESPINRGGGGGGSVGWP